ncbi:unnamed protein product [Paramecium octaurelia]|uniref:Uncharacterized protein n=1 Tax=Paramecium octaurelia TaxID=43137 RepID=A0A8S1U4M8_PAROT|nr:unnamed protein product [Paramecium octaurelia]
MQEHVNIIFDDLQMGNLILFIIQYLNSQDFLYAQMISYLCLRTSLQRFILQKFNLA